MTFDPTKPVRTRGGREAKILSAESHATWGNDANPIIAEVQEANGVWNIYRYFADGRFTASGECADDLVNVPERRSLWQIVYSYGPGEAYDSRDEADISAGRGRSGDRIEPCLGLIELVYEDDRLVGVIRHEG